MRSKASKRILIAGDESRDEVAAILKRSGFRADVAPDDDATLLSFELGKYEVVLISISAAAVPHSPLLSKMKKSAHCCLLLVTDREANVSDSAARIIQRVIPRPIDEHDLLDSVYGVISA